MDKFSRPYCKDCKMIWGKRNIGFVMNCTKCNKPLIMKSFNPWIQVIGGATVIIAGVITLVVDVIPIIWIGGGLWGLFLIFGGLKQWFDIKALDEK